MVIDGSKFFTKILSVVDWSSLFLNFSQDLPGTVFEVSATALCIDKFYCKKAYNINANKFNLVRVRISIESIEIP